ncbi:MAG: ADP-forming succinate--CoA ligase subunit beta [Candidatus Eisenbacteria bacterium]|uniref:Succinate--CoA ligase [ADP-forming] subunit beta n=1 Tax=Eiseniibacteriota bacterium TaxID=2212470 RepID=A0A948RTH2_UNCEI|nr:ADP-forming succinate--CoA ligase subunit beta [Candidatus Eisenbacteria bacterium]MBU1948929.1 ADP-forming succinate--CoA ligase subunit beta [Candidatus Eisenbacteria bacterium]MBU2690585.1 ADP-forming succinate--CoA ligase subunit beta [Candidatus Eisenbacteria bacterium]
MNLHEYQAKEIFSKFGITVKGGELVRSPEEAAAAAERMGGMVVVKAQVHSGGRGKAGGIKLAKTPKEARAAAAAILGLDIRGHEVKKVFVTPAADIDHEYYLGIVLDRAKGLPLIMVSREGGVDIETVAKERPDQLKKFHFHPSVGLRSYDARWLAGGIESDPAGRKSIAAILTKLAKCYVDCDASLTEINPLVRLKDGSFLALDAKMTLDDSGLFKHPDLAELRDMDEEDKDEDRARRDGLSFIRLEGNIGCIVNGAGLAMATMDLVKHFGGEPANFLDIGGSSNPDKVVTALDIITKDPSVKVILFNIFGGITRCDDVAKGLAKALEIKPVALPIVIRLTGTNEAEAREFLKKVSGVEAQGTMEDAVRRAVELTNAGGGAQR